MLAAYRAQVPQGDDADEAGATTGAPAAWVERITPARFDGETVIVTGAASGIGRAVAARIAREGGRVIAADITSTGLDALVDTLPGTVIIPVVGDISNEDDVARIVAIADGRIDALANIAGIMDDMSAIHEVTDAIWERVFRVNVTGMMRLTRAVVPVMLKAGHGRIVNIASEGGLRGSAAGVTYTAAKHAVIGITRSTAVMYARHGIRCNAVAPGGVATGIQVAGAAAHGAPILSGYLSNMLSLAQPEELAASITFLLSADSTNINGAVLASDGGWSAV
jgi:NAD(P)-dependent dehydrogenase (short-subunit alcohol dehydrogenase family)